VQLCAPAAGTVVVLATEQVPVPVPIDPPLAIETVYVDAPPSETNETLIAPLPAFTTVGVGMTAVGVTEFEADDAPDDVLLPLGVTMNV
jgi:hypothetical protein